MRDRLAYFASMYLRYRQKPPRVVAMLLKPASVPGLAAALGLGIMFFVVFDFPVVWPVLLAGMFLGAACRDLGWTIRVAKGWPFVEQLLDWKKIETIAAEKDRE